MIVVIINGVAFINTMAIRWQYYRVGCVLLRVNVRNRCFLLVVVAAVVLL